jgi:hypothetical protein
VYTAIPSANPFANDAFTLLWRISGDEAEQIGRLPHSILFSPVQWTANGSRLGYAARDTDAPPTLVLANGNGQDAATYITGEQIQFWGWSGDAQHFLYATTSAIGVGQSNSEPVEIPIPSGGTVSEVNWLTNNRYLVTTRFGAGWRLDSGHVNGSTSELLVVPGSDTIEYDVWLP